MALCALSVGQGMLHWRVEIRILSQIIETSRDGSSGHVVEKCVKDHMIDR